MGPRGLFIIAAFNCHCCWPSLTALCRLVCGRDVAVVVSQGALWGLWRRGALLFEGAGLKFSPEPPFRGEPRGLNEGQFVTVVLNLLSVVIPGGICVFLLLLSRLKKIMVGASPRPCVSSSVSKAQSSLSGT